MSSEFFAGNNELVHTFEDVNIKGHESFQRSTVTIARRYKLMLESTILSKNFPATAIGSTQFLETLRDSVKVISYGDFNPRFLFEMKDGSLVPTMTQLYCYPLFLTGLACTTEMMFVEFGTWAGASTRCLAIGLKLSKCDASFQVLDYFKPHQLFKLQSSRFQAQNDINMLKVWKEVVWEVNEGVQPFVGRIDRGMTESFSRTWQQYGIDVFIIDSAKSHRQLLEQTFHVWDNLNVGAILHLMDFAKTPQVELVYLLLKPQGYLSLAYLSFCASPWTFVVEKRLNWSLLHQFSIKALPCSSVVEGFHDAKKDIDKYALAMKVAPHLTDCVHRMILQRERIAMRYCKQ